MADFKQRGPRPYRWAPPLAVLGTVAALALGSGGAVARPTSAAIPSPNSSSYVNGVACAPASDCWAVGHHDTFSPNIDWNDAFRWHGKAWTSVSPPNPGGTSSGDINQPFAISCLTASNCWAVGLAQSSGMAQVDQALHWNGSSWVSHRTPDPGGKSPGDQSSLNGVACLSGSNCWAVGWSQVSGEAPRNQALHWNGTKWSSVSVPSPGGTGSGARTRLSGVFCTSSSNCWAVGYSSPDGVIYRNVALRWNGKSWARVTTPQPGGSAPNDSLDAVSCVSASHCWAVGSAANSAGAYVNEVLFFNGKRWSLGKIPQPGGTNAGDGSYLSSVFCVSASECWAVGGRQTGSKPPLNEAFRWNGTKWYGAGVPNPGGYATGDANSLLGVSCAAAANCWAVGQITHSGSFLNEAVHWNGSKWSAG